MGINNLNLAILLNAIAGLCTACDGNVAGSSAMSCATEVCNADAGDRDAPAGTVAQSDAFSGIAERADASTTTDSGPASNLVDRANPMTAPEVSDAALDVSVVSDALSNTDDGGPLTTAQLLKNVSADCYNCAMAHCSSSCESLVGDATGGVASGTSKRALCMETLSCELRNGCFVGDLGVVPCYCGSTSSVTCWTAGGAKGPCIQEWERSLEDTYPGTIYQRMVDHEYAGGVANAIAQCLHINHCFCP